jgi:cysteinyl-tRNA synthetase
MKYLGDTFDIHGGGLDNIFPHHECEIAQSEAATGKPFVKYWLHNNMVTVDGSKMSKSQGNFITIKDALARFPFSTLRFFILSSHYRSNLDFSGDALKAAHTGAEKLIATVRQVRKKMELSREIKNFKRPFDPKTFQQSFEEQMNDDFNTPRAIAVLFDLSRETNQYLNSNREWDKQFLAIINEIYTKLAGEVLGLIPDDLMSEDFSQDIENIINVVIDIRKQLRTEKQFQLADEIRNKLKKAGIALVDQPDGTTFEFD